MLDLQQLDLATLAEALEDHSDEHHWWLDPRSGEVELHLEELGVDEQELGVDERGDPEERGLVFVEPTDSTDAYADMANFSERVRDPRARAALQRAIGGRGAFRRFKDSLIDLPELRQVWFDFRDARTQRRAIEWLARHQLVDEAVAERATAARPDPRPPDLSGAFDAHELARDVAADLAQLYGERLRAVLLFGSWAREEAHPESDIDLLVVLDQVHSRRAERRLMSELLWRHSFDNDTVVTALPVSEHQYRAADLPLLVRVRAEGVPVA
ncbi:MAG: UPF0158 family protein [Actinomycetota bacterium]|nr:UPF0158 family protein [Actinomycetota bacterium]